MSGIAVAVLGASTAYGAYKGGQQKEAYGEAEEAAGQIKQEKIGLLTEERGLSEQATQSQYGAGVRDVSVGAMVGKRGIQAGGNIAMAQSGLATSGTIEQQVKTQTGDVMQKFKSDTQKLVETRDLSRTQADLSFRKGEISAEEAFQNTMAGMDPGGVGEGALGGLMSSVGTAATIAASDKRLKENIDYVGKSPSGIRMYEFNYLDSDIRHRGVIANELVDSHPNAVGKSKDGYYTVDYSQIDVDFEIVKGD